MGLVVEGGIDVLRSSNLVAELEAGSVFGEISFLYETARSVSLIARNAVLLWCWEPSWLADEVVRTGLRSEFEALADARARLLE